MRKIIYSLFIIFVIIILIFVLMRFNKRDDGEKIKNKVDKEMEYIDLQIVGMINNLNNISYQNYLVLQQNKNESSNNQTNVPITEESDNSSNSSGEQQKNNENENGIDSNTFDVIPNSILNSNRQANWDIVKTDIEKLYSTWSTVMLDLYKLNINNNDILQFTTILDNITMEIENQDKIKAINLLINLYEYIPKYMYNYTENNDIQMIFDMKVNILNSYALLEEDKWEDIKNELKTAENKLIKLLNESEYSNLNTDKIYVALKEMQNSIELMDKNIYYIKYKNLLEEMNTL